MITPSCPLAPRLLLSPTMVVRTVKILYLDMQSRGLRLLIKLLECFPCLEKLYVLLQSNPFDEDENSWHHSQQNLVGSCLDSHLKTIVFQSYQPISEIDINIAKFFVLNTKKLELMRFQIEAKYINNQKFIGELQKKLRVENKASRGALFDFTSARCLRDVDDIKHVRDLCLSDPFVC